MGTSPNFSQGQVPTAGQWNAAFAAKQDSLNFTPLNAAGGTLSGPLITTASIAGAAGLNIPPGAAPTLPNVGDIWNISGNLYVQGSGASLAVNEYQGGTVQINPANPATTVNGTGVMMGLGTGCVLSPLYSSRVGITIQGTVTTTSGTGVATLSVRTGTGVAPANGTGVSGVLVGNSIQNTITGVGQFRSFSLTGIVTGLTPGISQWFDLTAAISAGSTLSLSNLSCSIFEL